MPASARTLNGNGWRIRPMMVSTKMMNKCHAAGFKPSGTGNVVHAMNPTANSTATMNRERYAGSFQAAPAGAATD